MAFDSLSDRFQGIIKKIKGQGTITEKNIEEMLREVRLALLEADVNFKVVKEFTTAIKEKALGQEVMKSLTPGQMLVKIVKDELVALFGEGNNELTFNMNKPTIILMVGLQGSGKTTTTGKIANYLRKKNKKNPLLIAADIYRPAAIDQLVTIGKQLSIPVYEEGTKANPVSIALNGYNKALNSGHDVVIVDTAGRLHIDEALMDELVAIKAALKPTEILLVVDAMAGQDVLNVAVAFHKRLNLTGSIMTKLDGDARGGAALSINHVAHVPLKFIATGEKMDDLELFHGDRMADRILGMGDILTIIESASELDIDEKGIKKAVNRLMSGKFDLNDMLNQMEQTRKMGALSKMVKLIPGMPKISAEDEKKASIEMKKTKAIIQSMTMEERKNPAILKATRKVRIAKGCGMTVNDVNRLLKKYDQMKTMFSQFKNGKMPDMNQFFKH